MTVGIRLTDTMRMKTSDHDLVQAANRGDGDAFSALLSRHYDAIHGLAFRMLGSGADADDLAQDICAVLPYKLRSFRSDANFTQNSMMSLASDSENPHYSHPAFWAPFSLIGEGAALN